MKKNYVKPETECLKVQFEAIMETMLGMSETKANPDNAVLSKERQFINFAEDNGLN